MPTQSQPKLIGAANYSTDYQITPRTVLATIHCVSSGRTWSRRFRSRLANNQRAAKEWAEAEIQGLVESQSQFRK